MNHFTQQVWVAVSFLTLGALSGFVVGASSTPVAGIFLPLLIGLTGSFTFTMVDRFSRAKSIGDQIDQLGLDAEIAQKVKSVHDVQQNLQWTPGFWGLAIVLFCIACFVAIPSGSWFRSPPNYSLVNELLVDEKERFAKLKPDDRAKLVNLYWRLRAQKLSEKEIKEVFTSTVFPAIELRPTIEEHNAYVKSVRDKLGDVLQRLQAEFVDKEEKAFTSEYHAKLWNSLNGLLSVLPVSRDPLDSALDSLLSSFSPIDPQTLLNPLDTPIITSQTVK